MEIRTHKRAPKTMPFDILDSLFKQLNQIINVRIALKSILDREANTQRSRNLILLRVRELDT